MRRLLPTPICLILLILACTACTGKVHQFPPDDTSVRLDSTHLPIV